MKYDFTLSGKPPPPFDPSQPFEEEEDSIPPFDASQPFEDLGDSPENKSKQREPIAKGIAKALGTLTKIPAPLTEALLLRGGRVGDFAAGVVPQVAGSTVGGLGGVPGVVAGGAGGGALGEGLVQTRQFFRGELDEPSWARVGGATAASAIPLPKLPAATGPVRTLVTRGLQGLGIGLTGEGVTQTLEGEFDPWRLAEAGAWSTLFGTAAGGPEYLARSRALTKWARSIGIEDYKNTPEDQQFLKDVLIQQMRERRQRGPADGPPAPTPEPPPLWETARRVEPETTAEQNFNRLQAGEPVVPKLPDDGVLASPEIYPTAEAAAAGGPVRPDFSLADLPAPKIAPGTKPDQLRPQLLQQLVASLPEGHPLAAQLAKQGHFALSDDTPVSGIEDDHNAMVAFHDEVKAAQEPQQKELQAQLDKLGPRKQNTPEAKAIKAQLHAYNERLSGILDTAEENYNAAWENYWTQQEGRLQAAGIPEEQWPDVHDAMVDALTGRAGRETNWEKDVGQVAAEVIDGFSGHAPAGPPTYVAPPTGSIPLPTHSAPPTGSIPLPTYGVTETRTGGFVKNPNAGDLMALVEQERKKQAAHLPTEAPALAPRPASPEATANAADASGAIAGTGDAHGVAGSADIAAPAAEYQKLYNFRGRVSSQPAGQPIPAHVITADQWAEIQHLRKKPDAFKKAFQSKLEANKRLAKAEAKNAGSREALTAKKGTGPRFGARADGETDIIDAIQDLGGVPRPGDNPSGHFDGFEDAFLRGSAKMLVSRKTGHWDGFMQDLVASYPQFAHMVDFHAPQLAGEVKKALTSRQQLKARLSKERQDTRNAIKSGKQLQPVAQDEARPDEPYSAEDYPFQEDPAPYDVQLNESAETYATLAAKLKQLRTEAQSRPLTQQESEALDHLDRTLGQDFMDFYDADRGQAGAPLGDAKALQRSELQRRMDAPLQGGQLESQIDMLGPTTDKDGQTSLFEDAAQNYLTEKGVTEPDRRAAAREVLQAIVERRAEQKLAQAKREDLGEAAYAVAVREGKVYPEQGELDLFGGGRGADDTAAGPGALSREQGEVLGQLGTPEGRGKLAELLRNPLRVSTIVGHLEAERMPFLKWQGLKMATPEDFASLAATLRNPYQERCGVAVLDAEGKILDAAVLSAGSTTSALISPDMVMRELAKHGKNARSFYLWHNHPSGHPEPSAGDVLVTRLFRDVEWPHGVTMRDHIITNRSKFYTFDQQTTLPMAPLPLANWEVVPREDLHLLNSGERLNNLVNTVRTHGQTGVMIATLNRKNYLVGLDLLDPAVQSPLEIFQHAFEAAAVHGGTGVSIHWPEMTHPQLRDLSAKFKRTATIDLIDAGSNQIQSYRNTGLLEPAAPYGGKDLREDPAPYDPAKPLLILDGNGNVVGAQELGGLEHVRPVEMPELVQLAREMTGLTPGLKNFPKALGMFYSDGSKGGFIMLDRRGFKDPIRVQQTLAHEIGHAKDYQPDQTLERGNLGGRIQSLREHLTTTFPLSPKSGDAITAKERKDLYQTVGKSLGKRPSKEEDPAGHAAWGEERSRRYKEEIEALIQERKLTKESVVRSELLDLDHWWSPWEVEKVPESYKKYRESSVELYAQAISVLLNAPGELKERAPIFWQSLFNYMDRKPEVLQQFFDLWTHLYRGKLGVITERNARLKAGFGRGEEIFMRKAAERDAKQNTLQGIVDGVKQKHFDIFSPAIDKARAVKKSGRVLPWHQDPEYIFDAHPLADNDNYRLLDRVHKQVVAPLESAGMTQSDLGLYLFHNRVLNEAYLVDGDLTGRAVIANPEGITPIQARQALLEMRLRFGPERMTLLERTARKFQDEVFAIVQKGGEAGIYSRENVARAAANRYNYAAFAVLDFLEKTGHIPAAIRQQRGTLEAIANPFTASLMKSLTALKLIEHNTNKAVTVKLLAQHFPGEVEVAPVSKIPLASGGYMSKTPPPPPGKEELVVLQNGKPVTYWVEPSTAKMFDRLMPASAHAVVKVLNWTFRNVFYPAFITYNPAFQLYLSPMRDLRRSYVNLPAGVTRRKWLGEQVRTWEAAKSRLLVQTDPADLQRRRQLVALRKRRPLTPEEKEQLDLLNNRALVIEMLATRAIGSPFDSFVRNPTREDYFGKLLQEYELLPPDKRADWMENKFVKPVRAVGGWIERTGMTFEALPKMAAYRVLTRDLGWPAHEAAQYVRNHIGVPNYLRRGEWATVDGTVLPFLNVFMQGFASDVRQATGKALGPVDPRKQRFEWWRRMAENTLVPRLLQALAAAGVLGAALKEIYDGVSEYDKANYTVIPLGLSNQPTGGPRKSVYMRLPEDETARVMGGVMHYLVQQAMNDDPAAKSSLTDLVAFTGGQVPSINPMLTLGGGWMSYWAGQNPIDQFRGEKVLSNVEFNAGGWTGLRGMLAWTWRETGGANFVRWDPKSDNVAEFTLSSVPGLNRLVKVTDAGHRERQENLERGYDKQTAQIRAAMPPSVNHLLGEYYGLSSMHADNRTDAQNYRLKSLSIWHSKVWTPNFELMQQTTDKGHWKATGESLKEMSEAWWK